METLVFRSVIRQSAHPCCFAFQGHLQCITDAQTAESRACPTGFPKTSVFTSGKFSHQYCQGKYFRCRWESRLIGGASHENVGATGWTTTPPWQEWPPTALTKVPPAALGCGGPSTRLARDPVGHAWISAVCASVMHCRCP